MFVAIPLVLATMIGLQQRTDTTVAAPAGARLEIYNFAGSVRIDTWDRAEVRIRADHGTRDRIGIEVRGGLIRVRAARARGKEAAIDYDLMVPRTMAVGSMDRDRRHRRGRGRRSPGGERGRRHHRAERRRRRVPQLGGRGDPVGRWAWDRPSHRGRGRRLDHRSARRGDGRNRGGRRHVGWGRERQRGCRHGGGRHRLPGHGAGRGRLPPDHPRG